MLGFVNVFFYFFTKSYIFFHHHHQQQQYRLHISIVCIIYISYHHTFIVSELFFIHIYILSFSFF